MCGFNSQVYIYMAVGQNLVPLVNPKIAGKWMFIPTKNGINRYWSIPIYVRLDTNLLLDSFSAKAPTQRPPKRRDKPWRSRPARVIPPIKTTDPGRRNPRRIHTEKPEIWCMVLICLVPHRYLYVTYISSKISSLLFVNRQFIRSDLTSGGPPSYRLYRTVFKLK